MNGPTATASAHNPTIKTEPRELTELRAKIQAVVDLCLDSMTITPTECLTNTDTIAPTDVLEALGIEYGPGSGLAARVRKEG